LKKMIGAWMITALVASTLAGCTPDPVEETKKAEEPAKTETPKQEEKKPAENTPTGTENAESTEASHQEIREAYGLTDGYVAVTPVLLTSIAMGKVEQLALEPDATLALAKAISAAMAESGWKQGDLPPGIFLGLDGSTFSIGRKLQNGDLTLTSYELQADKTYKNVGTENKAGKK